MTNLVVAYFAMSGNYNSVAAAKWLSFARGERDSFLVNRLKQLTLRASMENQVVLLPMDLPAAPCDPQFYSEHMRDSLVLLCCDVAATGQVALVALGVFAGGELYKNTLDPSKRFRGRRDTFNGMPPQDANILLAPVHVLTCLLRCDPGAQPVTLDSVLGVQPDLTQHLVDPRLPLPLQLVATDVQAHLGTAMVAHQPGTPQHAAWQLTRAAYQALQNVQAKRSDTVTDGPRVQLVKLVLDTLGGASGSGSGASARGGVQLPLTQRQQTADRKKKNKAAFDLPRLLADGAANVRDCLHMVYNDYAELEAIFKLSFS